MIEQVLNRDFVLDQLERVRAELAKGRLEDADDPRRDATAAPLPYKNTPEDIAHAAEVLTAAQGAEHAHSSGQKNFEIPASDRRGGAVAAPIDDFAYLSHNPTISLLQTAIEAYFREVRSDLKKTTNEDLLPR